MNTIVVKIGGSTLGHNDTTIEDVIEAQKRGLNIVVVHGGGKEVTEWLKKLNVETRFLHGLRVTDFETLQVVTAVLSGLVNKDIVADMINRGAKAIGISGVDGGLINARNDNSDLGYTGNAIEVNRTLLEILIKEGYIPVISPIGYGKIVGDLHNTNLLNVNADTAAGEIAAAISADKLIFLTDVPGIVDAEGNVIHQLSGAEARTLIQNGTAKGGMEAKIEACLMSLRTVPKARIIDGRQPHALMKELEGEADLDGTTIAV